MDTKQHAAGRMDWESVALPVLLMLTGLILIGGDFLGVLSLDRIQNLWPAPVILIGLTELTGVPNRRES
jgi:hypothetical protein